MIEDREARGAPHWEVKADVSQIPLEQPSEFLACGQHVTCATVYANVSRMTGAFDPATDPSVVRVDLVANLANFRRPVASAFLLPGFQGPCINVTGLAAESFHVEVSGTQPRQRLRLAMTTRACCASFSVNVPGDLLEFPTTVPVEKTFHLNRQRAPFPWGGTVGQVWTYASSDSSGAQMNLPGDATVNGFGNGLRLTQLLFNGANAAANVTIVSTRGFPRTFFSGPLNNADIRFPGTFEIQSVSWASLRALALIGVR